MFLSALILHPEFVESRSADDVACIVAAGDEVRLGGMMQRMCNEGSFRIATFKRDGDFCPLDKREMMTIGITGIYPRQTDGHTFIAFHLEVQIKLKLNPIAALCIEMRVFVIIY
ncbi:hypothetical protein D3C81_1742480 [compost metagenome]